MPKWLENNEHSRGWLSRGMNICSCQVILRRVYSVLSFDHMLKQHSSILWMLSSSYLVQMERVQAPLNHPFWFCVASIMSCSACVNYQVDDNWNQPCYDLRLHLHLHHHPQEWQIEIYTMFPLGARGPITLIIIAFCLSFLGLATLSVHFWWGVPHPEASFSLRSLFCTCHSFLYIPLARSWMSSPSSSLWI